MMVATKSPAEAHYLAGMLGNIVSRYSVASYILNISTSTAILENLAIPRYEDGNRPHQAISECSRRLHEAAKVAAPLDELDGKLDVLTARLFGITDEQLSEIRESYRELTKADLGWPPWELTISHKRKSDMRCDDMPLRQSQRFIEAARKLGADRSEEAQK